MTAMHTHTFEYNQCIVSRARTLGELRVGLCGSSPEYHREKIPHIQHPQPWEPEASGKIHCTRVAKRGIAIQGTLAQPSASGTKSGPKCLSSSHSRNGIMVLTFSCKIDLGRLLIGLGMEGPHHCLDCFFLRNTSLDDPYNSCCKPKHT